MAIFLSLPALVSLLALAAHFIRQASGFFSLGQRLNAWICLGLALGSILVCGLLMMRKWWTLYIVQTVLALAVIEWLFTARALVQERQAEGLPWERAAAILIGVACLNVVAAVLLRFRKQS